MREEERKCEKLQKDIMDEERALFEEEKIKANDQLEGAKLEILNERREVEDAKTLLSKDRVKLEYDWTQREITIEQHEQKLAEVSASDCIQTAWESSLTEAAIGFPGKENVR
mgnify:CR=1 FL=1